MQENKWVNVCYSHRAVSPPLTVTFTFMLIYVNLGAGVEFAFTQRCPVGCLVGSWLASSVPLQTFNSTPSSCSQPIMCRQLLNSRPTSSIRGDWTPPLRLVASAPTHSRILCSSCKQTTSSAQGLFFFINTFSADLAPVYIFVVWVMLEIFGFSGAVLVLFVL